MGRVKRRPFKYSGSHTASAVRCSYCGKDLHHNQQAARRAAEVLSLERHYELYVYACPFGNGWHLTKKFQ